MGVRPVFPPCLLLLLVPVCQCFQWAGTLQDGDHVSACVDSNVSLPWNFTLSPGEKVLDVDWSFRSAKGDEVTIATSTGGLFLATPTFSQRVHNVTNGGLVLSHVTLKDNGQYRVKVDVYEADGTFHVYRKTAHVEVTDTLWVREEPDAVYDPVTDSWHATLACGTVVSPDQSPDHIVWQTPSGVVPSTKYEDGHFYLQLENPVRGGNYSCSLAPHTKTSVCLPLSSQKPTVEVDEIRARFSVLEAKSTHLKTENADLRDKVNATETELTKTQTILAQTQTKLTQTQTELSKTQTELDQTKTELAQSETELAKTQTELNQTRTELAETKIDLTETKTEVSETKTELLAVLTQTKAELTYTTTELIETKTELIQTRTELTQTKAELAGLGMQLTQTKTELETELTQIKTELNQTKTELKTELTQTKTELKTELTQTKTELAQTNTDLNQTMTELSQTTTELTQAKTELEIELTTTKKTLSQTRSELAHTNTELTQTRTELTQTKTELTQTKTDLTQTKRGLETEIGNLRRLYTGLVSKTDALQESAQRRVSFYARLTKDTQFREDRPVILTKVETNQGNGYSGSTGSFTAPYSGTYFFAATAGYYDGKKYAGVHVMVDSKEICTTYSRNSNEVDDSNTCTVTVHLRAGQKVWLKSWDTADFNDATSTFTGFLVSADN